MDSQSEPEKTQPPVSSSQPEKNTAPANNSTATSSSAAANNSAAKGSSTVNAGSLPTNGSTDEALSLADELGIEDLFDPIFGGRGRLFSAAGRNSPVAEFTPKHLILHPPQKPFEEVGDEDDIAARVDGRGVLLDDFQQPKRISGAKFRGNALYWLGKQKLGTLRYFAGWFDEQGRPHMLFVNGEPITVDIVFRLRNKTHDGEISIFPDLESDDKPSEKS